jgi:hypothetical protein
MILNYIGGCPFSKNIGGRMYDLYTTSCSKILKFLPSPFPEAFGLSEQNRVFMGQNFHSRLGFILWSQN